jgi:hypothetical protein
MPEHREPPRDPDQSAKVILKVGNQPPTPVEHNKDPATAAPGGRGGAIRAKRLSDERRKEVARKAAASGWKRD